MGDTAVLYVSGPNPNKVITAVSSPSEPQESRKPRAVRRRSGRRLDQTAQLSHQPAW